MCFYNSCLVQLLLSLWKKRKTLGFLNQFEFVLGLLLAYMRTQLKGRFSFMNSSNLRFQQIDWFIRRLKKHPALAPKPKICTFAKCLKHQRNSDSGFKLYRVMELKLRIEKVELRLKHSLARQTASRKRAFAKQHWPKSKLRSALENTWEVFQSV